MKKNYISPALQPMDLDVERMIANSIGIGIADKTTGEAEITEVDAPENPFGETIFD